MVIEKLFIKIRANRAISITLPHGELKLSENQPNRNEKFLYEINEVESKGNVLSITPLANMTNPEFINIYLDYSLAYFQYPRFNQLYERDYSFKLKLSIFYNFFLTFFKLIFTTTFIYFCV